MLQLRQLNLKLAFARPGALREDVENQRRAIEHFALENLFQVAALRGRKFVVKDDRIDILAPAMPAASQPARPSEAPAPAAARKTLIEIKSETVGTFYAQPKPGEPSYIKLGDRITRLDRVEPDLNSAIPGDVRDTTTPKAMVANLGVVLLGDHLGRAARDQLIAWLVGSTTGTDKLRAGLPATWRVGDKTGMGGHGATNDVAVAWPVNRGPVLVAAYLADTEADVAGRNDALADVGHAVGRWVQAA